MGALTPELIAALETALRRLRAGECDLDDAAAARLVRAFHEESDERRPLVKTEVAAMLGVTTRTIDRYVATGTLRKGRKRASHKTPYWLKCDVDECRDAMRRTARDRR